MSRYIDADALIEDLNLLLEETQTKTGCSFCDDVSYGEVLSCIEVQDIEYENPTVEAVPRDELIKLAKKVSDMREAQKRYFKGRSLNDLTVSKQLEAEVDATVKAILDPDLTLF